MQEPKERIIARAAKLLGVEPHNLSEEEAIKAIQRTTMRGGSRIRKASKDVTGRE